MTCPRSTRFNTATKICDSKRAVPCPASGSKPMPSVAPAGVINGGGENGFANSEWREHFRSSIFTSWVLSSCELVLVTSPLDEDMISSVCLFLHRRCPSNCTNLLVFPICYLVIIRTSSYTHRTRRGSRFDLGSQSKFQPNMIVRCPNNQKMQKRKKSVEGPSHMDFQISYLSTKRQRRFYSSSLRPMRNH